MEVLSFTDGNDQQGAPPSDPVGCLYRDILTKDGQNSPETSQAGTCRAESERSADSQSGNRRSEQSFNRQPEPQERNTSAWLSPEPRSDVAPPEEDRPPPQAAQQININQPIRSLCGAVRVGSQGLLTVTGAIQTISEEEILKDREPEEGIRNIPRFQNYQPGIPSRVSPGLSFISHKSCVTMETRSGCGVGATDWRFLFVGSLREEPEQARLGGPAGGALFSV